jgi:hypothetical protein
MAPIAALATVLAIGLVSPARADAQSAGVSSPSSQTGPAVDQPVFRLGDAARPFGWSTVVGDFNRDGRADVAVADRTRGRAGRYAYHLEFAVAGRTAQRVTFESSQSTLTIRLADVDRDHDDDIVVVAPLSGETVSVWLNDGDGRFSAASAPLSLPIVSGTTSLAAANETGSAVAIVPSGRRLHDARRPGAIAIAAPSDICDVTAPSGPVFRAHPSLTRLRPRAPPSAAPAVSVIL